MQGSGRRQGGKRRVAVLLFEKSYPSLVGSCLDVATCSSAEGWSFDDLTSRRAAESELAGKGVRVRCRSALKPLVCTFLEEVPTDSLTRAEITYPVHPAAPAGRFLLEAYPLPAMFPEVSFVFRPGVSSDALPAYDLHLTYAGGQVRRLSVLAPNAVGADGVLSPCGWLIRDGVGARMDTVYETIFRDIMQAVEAFDWRAPPCFEELNIAVTLPARDDGLGWEDKALSLTEALHEELYFSVLEYFQRRFDRSAGDRTLQPGQIVPEVVSGTEYTVRVEMRPWDFGQPEVATQPLDHARSALSFRQIADELAGIPGHVFDARSVAGRQIGARYLIGADRPVLITAGQHANEISGPVGALRAGHELARRAGAHFALCPLENPDGYALQLRLAQDNPGHMLHAARYTALGDDLEYRAGPPAGESGLRGQLMQQSGALLHVSLHGYPAHEWLRPLSGYLPRGFETWTLPRGFFLILRYQPGWAAAAHRLLEGVTGRLGQLPGQVGFNLAQLALAQFHGVGQDEMMNGFACRLVEAADAPVPLTLLTEYPDETLYDAPFVAAHQAQFAAVIAAYEVWQELEGWDWPLV